MKNLLYHLLLLCITFLSLGQAKTYDFPKPVDTKTKEIVRQKKEVKKLTESLFADNLFKGARMNDAYLVDDTHIEISIEPENYPINSSPWYAFRLWSKEGSQAKTIRILYSENFRHRYWPNYSSDGENWSRVDSSAISIAIDTSYVEIQLDIPEDTVWIAAQPIINSDHVKSWVSQLIQSDFVKELKSGRSMGKQKIFSLQITKGSPKNKDIIVCLSRQHPPEVTGYLALKAFLEKILDQSTLSENFLNNYILLVYPLINPDGVDEGHWRHGFGGVDLNRDWAYYHQPETRFVANQIVRQVKKNKGRVILGLDFHSTYYDVYYTTDRKLDVVNSDFTDPWLEYIKGQIEDYNPRDAPSGLRTPTSKGWFATQFNANGITYEIGDNTPPEFIKRKSKVAAEGMMKILLENNPK